MTASYNRMAAIVGLLLDGPCTITEAVDVLGLKTHTPGGYRSSAAFISVGRIFKSLEAAGLAAKGKMRPQPPGVTGRPAQEWVWKGNK